MAVTSIFPRVLVTAIGRHRVAYSFMVGGLCNFLYRIQEKLHHGAGSCGKSVPGTAEDTSWRHAEEDTQCINLNW
jgi:hypothetical protein